MAATGHYSVNPIYVKLTALIPEIGKMDMDEVERLLEPGTANPICRTLQDYWLIDKQGSTINLTVEDFGKHVVLYHIDKTTKSLWAHLGAARPICRFLGVPYGKTRFVPLFSYAIGVSRQNGKSHRPPESKHVRHEASRLLTVRENLHRDLEASRQRIRELTYNTRSIVITEEEAQLSEATLDMLFDLCVAEETHAKLEVILSVISFETELVCAESQMPTL